MLRLLFVLLLASSCHCRLKQLRTQLVREVLPGIGSYFFNPTPLNWASAAEFCRSSRNETLAHPYTSDEAELLRTLMSMYDVDYIHVGFHDKFKEGVYYTVTGDRVSETCFDTWYNGPGGTENNCGAFRGGSYQGLMDTPCSTEYPSICVNYNFFKEDYDFVPGYGYYKLHRSRRSWYDAQQTCESEGAQLLVLNSEGELSALVARLGQFTVWVGVHHIHANHQFLTIYDEPLSSSGFERWMSGEPSGRNDEKPYVTCSSTEGQGLALSGASDVNQFICESPLGARSPPT